MNRGRNLVGKIKLWWGLWNGQKLIFAFVFVAVLFLVALWPIWIGDEGGWDHCQDAYSRAQTLEDTLRVDRMRAPVVRRDHPEPLTCGTLRRARQSESE